MTVPGDSRAAGSPADMAELRRTIDVWKSAGERRWADVAALVPRFAELARDPAASDDDVFAAGTGITAVLTTAGTVRPHEGTERADGTDSYREAEAYFRTQLDVQDVQERRATERVERPRQPGWQHQVRRVSPLVLHSTAVVRTAAHYYLGQALVGQGRLAEGREALEASLGESTRLPGLWAGVRAGRGTVSVRERLALGALGALYRSGVRDLVKHAREHLVALQARRESDAAVGVRSALGGRRARARAQSADSVRLPSGARRTVRRHRNGSRPR
ncbi:hypothetical protein DEF28_10595 [Marinitenerispora sediminis]|uniref:Uncharacterized protein n=2 Tax=Marinitenerispora sediminis TaxID=1931232 RepID=A0A368TA86_9ACTN|nr:hypothetical protein DEF28_10595 [Marinitenerispora sediminis]RCV61814.1 hypothetical protein DEF24_03595 [Marinitenerispora sediminis]